MNEFWHIVSDCRTGATGLAAFNSALERTLVALPREEVADFRLKWLACSEELYSWEVWDASALMLGGTDDDSFMDFRSWVISLGREAYASVLANADSLAEYGQTIEEAESVAAEQLAGLLTRTYRAMAGEDPPNPPEREVLSQPSGQRTNIRDRREIEAHFPRISDWLSRG